jgi:hypothetical protein
MILAAGFGVFCLASSGWFPLQDKLQLVLLAFLGGVLTMWLLASRQ